MLPVTPGNQTSEHKLAARVVLVSHVAAALGATLGGIGVKLALIPGAQAAAIPLVITGAVIAGLGTLAGLIQSTVYGAQRTAVKVAAGQASADDLKGVADQVKAVADTVANVAAQVKAVAPAGTKTADVAAAVAGAAGATGAAVDKARPFIADAVAVVDAVTGKATEPMPEVTPPKAPLGVDGMTSITGG